MCPYLQELLAKRRTFGRWDAFAFVLIKSRRLALILSRSFIDRFVNFSIYVYFG